MLQPFTVFTYQERLTLFDWKQWDKEQTQAAICSLQICLLQATRRAQSRCFINCLCPGLNACYEEKHLFAARDSGLVSRI